MPIYEKKLIEETAPTATIFMLSPAPSGTLIGYNEGSKFPCTPDDDALVSLGTWKEFSRVVTDLEWAILRNSTAYVDGANVLNSKDGTIVEEV